MSGRFPRPTKISSTSLSSSSSSSLFVQFDSRVIQLQRNHAIQRRDNRLSMRRRNTVASIGDPLGGGGGGGGFNDDDGAGDCSNDNGDAARTGHAPTCAGGNSRSLDGGGVSAINFPRDIGDGDVSGNELPGYLAVVYIALPVVVVVLVSVLVYIVFCRKKDRLNWYERSLIDTAQAPVECNGAEQIPTPLLPDDEDGESTSINSRQGSAEVRGCGCVVPGGYSVLPEEVYRSPYGQGTTCSLQSATKVTYVTVRTRSVDSHDSHSSSPVGEQVGSYTWAENSFRTTRKTSLQSRQESLKEEDSASPFAGSTSRNIGVRSYGGCGETRRSPLLVPICKSEESSEKPLSSSAFSAAGHSWAGYLREINLVGVFNSWTERLPGISADDSNIRDSGKISKPLEEEKEVEAATERRTSRRAFEKFSAEEGAIRSAFHQQLKLAMGTTQSSVSVAADDKRQGKPDMTQSGKVPEKGTGTRKPSVQFDAASVTKRGSLSSGTGVDPQLRRQSESSVLSFSAEGRSIGCTGIGSGFANVFGWSGGMNFTGNSSGSGSSSAKTVSANAEQESNEDQFWVPPAILQKKRAQSLIPQLFETKNGSSFSKSSPSSSDSIHDMTIALPIERLTESATLVQLPGSGQLQRRRRASMQDALDHTKIDASLYESSAHCDRIYSFEFPSIQEENLGSVNFALSYDLEQSLLTVRLIQARDLVPRDFSGTADPFCRLCVLPNRKNQLQSRVHKKTLIPEFEEEFIFDVPAADLASRTLEILMFDYDQFSHDECVGQIRFPLAHFNPNETVAYWKGLSMYEKKTEDECYGDLMFSMAYLPSAERLTVAVVKARKIRLLNDGNAAPNPFVRVSLVADGKKRKRKKTSTKRTTVNPIWNEALVFNVDKELLNAIQVELTIFNDNLLGNNDALGEVIIGRDTSGEELAHWTDVLHLKNAMARWHHIQHPQGTG